MTTIKIHGADKRQSLGKIASLLIHHLGEGEGRKLIDLITNAMMSADVDVECLKDDIATAVDEDAKRSEIERLEAQCKSARREVDAINDLRNVVKATHTMWWEPNMPVRRTDVRRK